MRKTVQNSAHIGVRSKLLVGAAMALPLVALSSQAQADPIQQSSEGDITVEAESASGTPIAVELSTTGGSIDVSVTTVTGVAQTGEHDYIVGLETLGDGTINGAFGSITGTGEGQLLALGASSNTGDINITVGEIAMDGEATAGLHGHSVGGDVTLQADSVVLDGTGIDPNFEVFPEGIFAHSEQGAATVIAGHAETHGQYGSAAIAIAGTDALVEVGTAIAHSDGAVAVHASGVNSATVRAGTVTETGNGTGIEGSSDGTVSIEADAVSAGSTGIYARAGGDISVTAGTVASGLASIDAVSGSGGSIVVDAGAVSSSGTTSAAVYAQTNADGSIGISVDQAQGAGVDRATIAATTENGDIAISGGSVTASGDAGLGVYATTVGGDVVVDLDSVATTGLGEVNGHVSEGVLAESINGNVTVSVGSASAEGFAASAVVALGGAGATITADQASAAGQHSAVLYASSSHGAASVDAGSITLRGDQQAGVNALAYGGAATVVVDSVLGEGTLGNGIYAEGTGGASVSSGTVEVERNGVGVFGLNDSGATITTSGNTTADTGYGLYASGGDVSITTGEGTLTSGATYGIRAAASDSATIVNGGTAQAMGHLGSAIHVVAPGAVSITSNAVVVTGAGAEPALRPDGYRSDQGGIVVDGGNGAIAIDAGSVDVEGEARYGITARGNGAIGITADTVNLASADSVAVVARGGAGHVSITTGAVTTTGASGVGVFGNSTTGNVTIDAGTTRVENEGIQGNFTGDAVVATSGSGHVKITSQDAFSAAYGGSAVVGISGGTVSIDSEVAETTGDAGIGLYASSGGANVSIISESLVVGGADTLAIAAIAQNGSAALVIGDLTASDDTARGIVARSMETRVTINGAVETGGDALVASGLGITGIADVNVNGSVTSTTGIGVSLTAQRGAVIVAEGASIDAARAGVALATLPSGDRGGLTVMNSGSISGSTAIYLNSVVDPVFGQAVDPNIYVRNNGTLVGTSGYAVFTGNDSDVLELTENSVIDGLVDLGAGEDRLVLDVNDDAAEGAVGHVASTINVEGLSVDSGSWVASGTRSAYGLVEVEEGATLTVAENADGEMAISTPHVELGGRLNLDLVSDTEAGNLTGLLIEGTGSLHLIGEATVLVLDASGLQYTGGTFVDNGALVLTDTWDGDVTTSGDGTFQLGNGGTGGDFTGDIVNNGTFVFARSDDYSLTGSFTGTGLTVKDGAGTLTFAGFYGFEGITSILNGSIAFTGNLGDDTQLELSDGGTVDLSQVQSGEQTIAELAGTGGNLVLGATDLAIDQSGDTVFSGSISGTGTLTKAGEGDLKLHGDSDFSGTGQVDGGTLSVNGSFANAGFFVNEGGTLGGTGTVGDTSIQGGTLAAGNSIGTLVVAGDLTFTSNSVLEVEVDPAGNADLIQVTGIATLGDAAVDVLAEAGTYAPFTDYTILTADGGISGTFGAATTNLAYLVPLLSYTVDTVSLRLARNDIDFSALGQTPNQQAVGGLIEALGFGNPLYYQALTLAQADVSGDFQTLTGEVYPAFGAQMIETIEMVRRQASQDASAQSGGFAWGTALGGWLQGDGGGDFADVDIDNKGLAAGVGYGFGGAIVSLGAGKVWQNADHAQLGDSELVFGTVQLAWSGAGGLHAKAGAMIGSIDGATSRATALNTLAATVSGEVEGNFRQLSGEVGYAIPLGAANVQPFVGISHVDIELDDLTETGGGTALSVSDMDRKVTFGDIGLRFEMASGEQFAPHASAAYRRAWGDRASTATIAFAGNTAGLAIAALPIAREAAELAAGLRYNSGAFGFDLGYSGTLSKTFDNHAIKLTGVVRF